MASSLVSLRKTGFEAAIRALRDLPPLLRKRALRNALAAGGRVVRNAIRGKVPVLSASDPAVRKGWRKPRTLQRAVSARTSKFFRKQGDVGVFVNVRPAKGSARGGKNPNDPFYWRWVDKGYNAANFDRSAAGKRARRRLAKAGAAKSVPGRFFMRAGALALPQALPVIERELGPQIQKLNSTRFVAR